MDEFGPDRVVFGGDWPVCTLAATYREWVSALQSIVASRPQADQKKLFSDNGDPGLSTFLKQDSLIDPDRYRFRQPGLRLGVARGQVQTTCMVGVQVGMAWILTGPRTPGHIHQP